jgi:hypothetical protein
MSPEPPSSGCAHCAALLVELDQCIPLTPTPDEWGETPFWGSRAMIRDTSYGDPAFMPRGCLCDCHAAWRMLNRGAA